MKNKLSYCDLLIAFQTKCMLINFFIFKEKFAVFLRSDIAYKFKNGGWNAKVKMCKELWVSALAGKTFKEDNDSAIEEHYLFCNHSSAWIYPCTLTNVRFLGKDWVFIREKVFPKQLFFAASGLGQSPHRLSWDKAQINVFQVIKWLTMTLNYIHDLRSYTNS